MPAPSAAERQRVEELLGRPVRSSFEVVVRSPDDDPIVIRNPPLLDDGTPMPTLYWLVGRPERQAVSRLEAAGGVRRAEEAVDPGELAAAHARYAQERDALLPPGWAGPRPSGGVGGTVSGVKCLHAHLAWFLAGADDPVGRWVAGQLDLGPVAALDCGTNSTRLLVADGRGRALERLMRITRLGEGVDATGRLSPAAVARTAEVLAEYRLRMRRHGVRRARLVATSAVRRAANGQALAEAAREASGVEPEVLSGAEEGRLAFLGATAELDPAAGPYLVADIGGGSTELVVGRVGGEVAGVVSLEVGCVRLTERFLAHDPPSSDELGRAGRHVDGLLEQAARQCPELAGARRLVGLAGTVSALAQLEAGLDHYRREAIHHFVLGRQAVQRLLAELASVPSAERAARFRLEPGRADVIVGGCVVLDRLMEHFGFDACLVSEADILDGLVLSLPGVGPPAGSLREAGLGG
jgi:exopolyphosphatase/guanosine-5'-triphosphate,3'-diphosphate pyrophosphatase